MSITDSGPVAMIADPAPEAAAADPGGPLQVIPVGVELEELADLIADKTARKFAEGVLQLPDSVRLALKEYAGGGYYLPPLFFGHGADQHQLRAYLRPDGLQLEIWGHGGRQWTAVLT